jgi:glyoxylase I family protein
LARQHVAMDFPAINGFGHIDLTVTDGERSARWWQQVMGFKLVDTHERRGFKAWTVYHPSGLAVGLLTHSNRVTDRFDERAVGLDHLAVRVPDRAALDAWAKHLDHLGIAHSGVQEERGGPLIVLRDPDNIQLELWAFDSNLV